MKDIFIGLVGVKESGKSTTMNYIREILSEARLTSKEVMNAFHLKMTCAKVFNLTFDHFELQSMKEVPFAKPLVLTKSLVEKCLNEFKLEANTDLSEHIGIDLTSPRKIAQYIGTQIVRSVQDDIHCSYAYENAKGANVYIVTDIRFPNEFSFFSAKASNFIPIFINNEKAIQHLIDSNETHESELYVVDMKDDCLVLDNNGTLEELKSGVKFILDKEL